MSVYFKMDVCKDCPRCGFNGMLVCREREKTIVTEEGKEKMSVYYEIDVCEDCPRLA